jgi:hypothetical protein
MGGSDITFIMRSWQETPYDEREGAGRLTRVTMVRTFEGGLSGEGRVEYLMAYAPDGTAAFVGLERVVGRLGDRAGTFVLRHEGTSAGDLVTDQWTVVPGSGTGGLAGLAGSGGFSSGRAERYPMTLAYTL